MAKQSFKFYTPRDKPKKRGPRQHKKNKNKQEKRQKSQKRYKGQGWQYPKISYIVGMKEKIITITVDGTNQGQWSNLLLELNLIKKAWRPFGVDITLKAPGVKNIIEWGTRNNDYIRPTRRNSNQVQQKQR
jgi:hypothetical protein